MKRLFATLLFVATCFALTGCGASTTEEVTTTAATTAETTTTEDVGDPLDNDSLIEEIVDRIKDLFE